MPDASPESCWILDARRGLLEPPIRSEIFGSDRFAQHGSSLAATHRAARAGWRDGSFFPLLLGNIRSLREAHRYIGTLADSGYDVSPAAEWLLDNFHLIEAQLQTIREDLPRGYFRSLPVLQDEPLAGLPRIYGVAWAFVAHTDGAFDEDLLVVFLASYLEVRELNLSELWALPTTLRVVLIEDLRRLADRVACHKAARELANLCCDHLPGQPVALLDAVLKLLDLRGVGGEFLLQFAQRWRDSVIPPEPALAEWLASALPDPAATGTQHSAGETADNLSVSNAITALRAIADADWPGLVARTSVLMRLMLASPAFAADAPPTRDQTLHDIERLALRHGLSEREVGTALLALMQAAPAPDAIEAVPVHWLRGTGRARLDHALGRQDSARHAALAVARAAAWPVYAVVLGLGSIAIVAWWLSRPGEIPAGVPAWCVALGAVLMLWPVSEAVIAVVHRLVSESLRPAHLPRWALPDGITAEHRVMVAVPAMLTSATGIAALSRRLLLHYLANPEPHAQFALLSDFADADGPRAADDARLLDCAIDTLRELNRAHPSPAEEPPRFVLLHRARQFSESEQRWIGWERKRGKLEQLLAMLATTGTVATGAADAPCAFVALGELSRVAPATRYLVTLDSDTQLPPGRLRELVGVAAHPYNRPRLDTTGRRVISGYGILQPRIAVPLPARGEGTLFHALFAGQCGIDPYSAATSEIYQDLFGEGSFNGKGLLHVRTAHAVLGGRLPEGRVLSHDLLEGSIARCAAVTDITVIEGSPFHADVAASRVHRWTRGDWQLIPYLLQPRRFAIRAVNRWKMLDNLRRSLVAPASLAWLALAVAGWSVPPWQALVMVLAAYAAGPMMGAAAGSAPRRSGVARRHFYAGAAADLLRAVAGGLWHVSMLGAQSLLSLDAMARALWRQAVSHRHLLEWTTTSAAEAALLPGLGATWRRHAAEPVLALTLLAALWMAGTPWPGLSTALCLWWAASPWWTWCGSLPWPPRPDRGPTLDDRAALDSVAHDTWRFFERVVGPDDHHLPPDNLQTLPHEMVAHRTSPTNIGLYLLSVACARQFGWIDEPQALVRLEATLATLQTLARHRGHFLNWYDTLSTEPLLPMYVSTVDSGNLSGHLLAVAQACREWRDAAGSLHSPVDRLTSLAERLESLAWEAQFGFLYHRKRHLFHIGYRVAEQQLDAGFYDLLASESRLTSLLAIAKGDVPVTHWMALGRPFFAVGTLAGLRSWSGSMFEYLMPALVLDEPPGSVLRNASRVALHEQMAFGRAHRVPWGMSESAYAGRDHTLAYQYAPQGVPRLALRRAPPEELVVAPYATALAALLTPHRAQLNLDALERLGARSEFGFIDALDFTPARQAGREAYTPVSTFMSHHQGMTVVALANVLLGGVAQRWGMANPRIEAVASLLHERAPREVSILHALPPAPVAHAGAAASPGLLREVLPGVCAVEPTQLLSNGRYRVSLRANGAGDSRWGDVGINRQRDDALRDELGSFFFLRWDRQPRAVSITQHPAPDRAAIYRASFHADRVSFDATWPDIHAVTTVWVSPEDDIEFRQVELHNTGTRVLDIELMSAFEITLADPRADEAHPAFSNMFLGACWQPRLQALLFERRPRRDGEPSIQAAHFLADHDPQITRLGLQADRRHWLGRNRAPSRPLARFDPAPPSVDSGMDVALDTGLDPVCALCVSLRLPPGNMATLTFATAVSDSRATLDAVIDKYHQPSHVQRASLMSATLAGVRLRTLGLSPESMALLQALTTALLFCMAGQRHARPGPAVCDRRLLWRFGLSGDRPIVLVMAGQIQGLGLVRTMAQALRWWSWAGVACDLVVVNAEPASYHMPLQHALSALRDRHSADDTPAARATTAMQLLRTDDLQPGELNSLQCLARLRLNADGRPVAQQLHEWLEQHEQDFDARHAVSTEPLAPVAGDPQTAQADGRFDARTADFHFDVWAGGQPARPWANVLSGPGFGCLLTEAGGGNTWAVNSRLNQLTAWSNDPVADPPSEWLLLQDMRSSQAWSLTPSAWGGQGVSHAVTHGPGYSEIRHTHDGLEVSVHWCVDPASAVKQIVVRVTNTGEVTRQLRLVGIVEWQLGATRSARATVHTGLWRQRLSSGHLTALWATQCEHYAGFGGGTATFSAAAPADETDDWTCDRRECFDARGGPVLPDHFGRRSGAGLDPCAALALRMRLAPGECGERVFLLCHGKDADAARELATRAAAEPARERRERVRAHWDRLLDATTVATPDPLFDAMVNRWLLYQTVACRLWAKAAFYQAGGATGFRDQLQDAMALSWAEPSMLRSQILLAASRQFVEGDVQHWWHAPGGAGVRTHFSDDLLWLPHACLHYLRCTGDRELLNEQVAFLQGPPVPEGAEDLYDTPVATDETAPIFEHAARAIDHSLAVGTHGLPLMGCGDWNDGMNRVGHRGRGESVWLGWFLCQLVEGFAPLAQQRSQPDRAARWLQASRGWRAALLGPAWDGQWFKRAFFDDGQPLGSHLNAEARIDLIAQAWAVLSDVAPPDLQRRAMAAVDVLLVDPDAGLIRLLDPPLADAVPSAGYIQAYPPGVRENGGQYSHAGVWALMARAKLAVADANSPGGADAVYRDFTWLSPAHRARHPVHGAAYGIEPYAMAGDTYSQPPRVGRGGWSWYTGAAAWLHRAAIESMFGLRLDAAGVGFQPCLPSHWPSAELTLRRGELAWRFIFVRARPREAIAAVASALAGAEATLLRPGASLGWPMLANSGCYVVPLFLDRAALEGHT